MIRQLKLLDLIRVYHLSVGSLVNKTAVVQFWLHQLATPVLLVALSLMLKADTSMEALVGLMSMVVGVSVLLFVYDVLRNLKITCWITPLPSAFQSTAAEIISCS
jgi:hypothetical protein